MMTACDEEFITRLEQYKQRKQNITPDKAHRDTGTPGWCHQVVLEYMQRRGLIKKI